MRTGTEKSNNVYDIGTLSENARYRGGLIGWYDEGGGWTNYSWLENIGATYCEGNLTGIYGRATSAEIKALVSNGTLPSTDWGTNASINNGYPYLKAFDDTSIWLRNSSINDGEPYLKNNPPQ